jgi:hypothetical protein
MASLIRCQLQRIQAPPTPELLEVVVLLRVLQSEVNIGYVIDVIDVIDVCSNPRSTLGTCANHVPGLERGMQVLTTAPALPHRYEDICGMVETFNGHRVASLMHLAQLAQLAQETGAELLECILVTGELLVLDAARCWETEDEIFSLHTIPRRCSFEVTPL